MKDKNKLYKKALNYYEKGNIKKALDKCNKAISENLKNNLALNLKGLILYVQGDLQDAVNTWKINADYNNDISAKRFLRDYKNDMKRKELYEKAEILLKDKKINESLELLNKCSESDFNRIKVSSALALCYIKKADYILASNELKKVFELDKKNILGKNIEKVINKYSGEKKIQKKYLLPLILGILAIIILISAILVYQKTNNNNLVDDINYSVQEDNKIEEIIEDNKDKEEDNGETKIKDLVDSEALNTAISNKDYNKIYIMINNLKDKDLEVNEKVLYEDGKKLLETEGIEVIYKDAMKLFNDKKYSEAISEFQKVYEYGSQSYLYQHSIYFIGTSNYRLNDFSSANKYYEEYYNKFKDGSYIEEVLYNLAIQYEKINIEKSKVYAKELIDKFPKSMYNNTNISEILSK